MRLKEVNIQKYGPLPKFLAIFSEGVNLIYGINESGKTLLIDAIMKKLIGGKSFHNSLERVDDTPEGYITLDQDGQEIKLSDDRPFTDITGISQDELRHIFVVRDADLRIDEEDVFYERVQDKIAGLWSSDIRRIIKTLEDRGRLRSTKTLSDDKKYGKPRSIVRKAKQLHKDITKYLEESKAQNIEELELEQIRARTVQEEAKNNVSQLEKSKKRQEYEKIKADIESIGILSEEYNLLPKDSLQSLREKIKTYEEYESETQSAIRKQNYFRNLSIGALILTGVTFLAVFLLSMPSISFSVPIFALLLSFYTIWQWRIADTLLSEYEKRELEIKQESKKIGINTEKINEIKAKLDQSTSRLEEIQVLIHEKSGVIKNFFSLTIKSTSKLIEKAKQQLTQMEGDIDLSITLEYSETELDRCRDMLKTAQSKIDEISNKLSTHEKSIQDFSTRMNDLNYSYFMPDELDITIENLDSLNYLLTPIEKLINKIEVDAKTAEKAIDIFESLESEEEEKIKELFSKESPATEIFSAITQGRYNNVRYDPNEGKIIVERPNGEYFKVESLSKGARDQLYLAVRVALGQKLLEGSPGFFIMDDAFLSADETRLNIQTDLLKQLSKKGWQIIYFTMKKEAVEAISEITENEPMVLAQLA